MFFFFNDTATTEIYTLSLHDALPISIDGPSVGLLKCACGTAYPIIDGVPRLLEGGLGAFPEFLIRYEEEVRAQGCVNLTPQHTPSRQRKDDFDAIRKSYSEVWGIFDYDGDKTWGWTLEDRKRVFLGDVALTEDQLRGKLLLDAGCGNGTLTAILSTLGLEVVGLDLHDRLGLANRQKARYAPERLENVHFVQGNVFNPPLKHGSFDLIYCSGVIHRMPNTKESFKKLVPLVKKGGRLYVWVAGNRGLVIRMLKKPGRYLRRFMSLETLLNTCRVLAPFYRMVTGLLRSVRIANFRKRTVREITLDLF